MEDKRIDEEIKASLLKNTDDASSKKEEIWAEIEGKLNFNKEEKVLELKPRSNSRKPERRKSKIWLTGAMAAAVFLGVFATTTDTGQAFVNTIREYFAPEKRVVVDIEGMPEEKEVVLQEGKAGYIIYIDEERYAMIPGEDMDKIVFNQELSDIYPEVSMSIRQVEGQAPEQVAKEIHAQLQQQFAEVREIAEVSEPLEGLLIAAIDGSEWNSKVARVYVVTNEKEGSFVIEQRFFLEAEEGHGARFEHMLRDFQVVEVEAE